MIELFRMWLTCRPLFNALMRFSKLLLMQPSGRYTSLPERDKAYAAFNAKYEIETQRAGWKPVKTVGEILKAKPFPEGKDKQ